MFLKFLSLTLLISIAFASQYVPVPLVYDGVHLGKHESRLHIEAFYDLMCPDSKASNTAFNQVFATTDVSNVQFTYHIFPLPYHIQAFTTAFGVRYFLKKFDANATIIYMNYVFETQDFITGSATFDRTQSQVVQEFAHNVTTHFAQYPQYNFTQPEFVAALQNRQYDIESRASWKYGCSRGIAATPVFLVNGVVLDRAEEFTAEDWQAFIQARTGQVVEVDL